MVRPRSRASIALEEAHSTPCPHCGRTSKTVQGVCADCWGVKNPEEALDFRPPPRTEPLLDLESDVEDLVGLDPRFLIAVALGVVVVIAVVVGLR